MSKLLYTDNTAKYKRGEQVARDVRNRGKFCVIHPWINHIAENGYDNSAFTTIGRWRYGDERDHSEPVFIPWFTIDIDRKSLHEAWNDVHDIIGKLHSNYVHLDRTYVSFSGKKGFHIQIEASQLNSPIFRNSTVARRVLVSFINELLPEHKIDPSPFSPTSLIRLSGSQHEETELYKTTWRAHKFLNLSSTEVSEIVQEGKPFTFDDPTTGTSSLKLLERFMQVVSSVEGKMKEQKKNKSTGPSKAGPMIRRIAEGIEEGEQWCDKYSGRNWAAYILACWLLEREGKDTAWAWDQIQRWDRERNDPPLQDEEDHSLERPFRSAINTILGKNYRWIRT